MAKYLIDVNLPDHFSLWHQDNYQYVKDIDAQWEDNIVWQYAMQNELTVVTKDRDFYDRILLKQPPPRVIFIRSGNLRIRDFYQLMHNVWTDVCALSEFNKLVMIYTNRIEAIE